MCRLRNLKFVPRIEVWDRSKRSPLLPLRLAFPSASATRGLIFILLPRVGRSSLKIIGDARKFARRTHLRYFCDNLGEQVRK